MHLAKWGSSGGESLLSDGGWEGERDEEVVKSQKRPPGLDRPRGGEKGQRGTPLCWDIAAQLWENCRTVLEGSALFFLAATKS